jgi:peptidyl-tRNA hydrolase
MKPTLYIIVRKDIPDLSPGKLGAQTAHAQAGFSQYEKSTYPDHDSIEIAFEQAVSEWKGNRSFGTTIVLEVNRDQLYSEIDTFTHSGFIIDPTYPWRNFYGELQLSEVTTCGWIFVYDGSDSYADTKALMKLKLHR